MPETQQPMSSDYNQDIIGSADDSRRNKGEQPEQTTEDLNQLVKQMETNNNEQAS